MGVWVKCNERMLEVTSFKINDKEVLKENGMFMLEKEGILLYSADAEIIMVDYESERYAYLAFNRLIKHIARLEMITRCLQGTDTSILCDPDMGDSLDELCNYKFSILRKISILWIVYFLAGKILVKSF